jgi:hypothetical protein
MEIVKIVITIIEKKIEFHLGVPNVEIRHANMSSKIGDRIWDQIC